MTELLREFLEYLHTQVENGSIYVWGGQGQTGSQITEEWIHKRETSTKNAERAIALWKKRIAEGKGDVLRAFDCSGLVMYFLQNLKGAYSHDMASNTIKGECQTIARGDLGPGDFVFRVYASGSRKGSAYHLGIVVDEDLHVIEAKGRDDGVVERPIDAQAGYWNYFGRLPVLFEGEPDNSQWTLSRLLKRTRPIMKGEDVKNAQKALISKGFSCGSRGADGQYGDDTVTAVRSFQKQSELTIDGIVGEDTCSALGGTWKAWSLSRLLKRTSPLVRGEDVKQVQAALIEAGYPCGKQGADGQYGDETEKAVKSFQKARGLKVDGIVGKNTCTALGGEWKGK